MNAAKISELLEDIKTKGTDESPGLVADAKHRSLKRNQAVRHLLSMNMKHSFRIIWFSANRH
nr:hypothetical protein [Bacillus velezensis]